MITPEIGKYYKDSNAIIRVDEIGSFGDPIGLMIYFDKELKKASIDYETSFNYMFCDGWITKEITKEEFQAKLKEVQELTNELFNDIDNDSHQ